MGEPAAADDGAILCPYCGDNVPRLTALEAGMKLRLQENAKVAQVPDQVCEGCFGMLAKMVSKGAVLRAEAQQKEQNRLMLWRNRVQLVKQAKNHLQQKNYSDSAVSFEKYLRVLEIVYECKPGELSPELFKNKARQQEMTVITSVYWDLMRIYDTHPSYMERQRKTAEKLADFARFTPIFPHIMRKAESQMKTAKNPDAFKKLLKLANKSRPRCFIATAAFDGYASPEVVSLCRFRDEYLVHSRAGRRFVYVYYKISPAIARSLDQCPWLKPFVRRVLAFIAESKFVTKGLS